MTKFTERKISEQSEKVTFHVLCQTDISPLLTMSKPTIVDIPRDPKLSKLSPKQIQNISKNPFESEKPRPQPSQFDQLTLEDFMKCVSQTEDDRRQKTKNEEQDRERDLMDLKRMLNLPP